MLKHDPFLGLSEEQRQKLSEQSKPDWISPMLATLTDEACDDPDWIYEWKLDGERVLAYKRGDLVRLLSRNKKGLNDAYPELADAVAGQPAEQMILDGEVVAFAGNITSFERLQERMQVKVRDEAQASRVAVSAPVWAPQGGSA